MIIYPKCTLNITIISWLRILLPSIIVYCKSDILTALIYTQILTSSDSDKNSCMMSLSPITRTEHTGEIKRERQRENVGNICKQLFSRFSSHSPFLCCLLLPFSKYSSSPRLRASSCCSDREKGHFPGSLGNAKFANSLFRF